MQAVLISNSNYTETLITQLWELGTVGIIENSHNLQAFFTDDADLTALKSGYVCHVSQVPETFMPAESACFAAGAEPILAGDRFVICSPSDREIAFPADRIAIQIDAQNAFGSGSHESTQLVIRALEKCVSATSVLLDVGSGSGILSVVAHRLGARTVFACDTHADSVLLTRRHSPTADVFLGSVDAVRSDSIDLVVANISAHVIDALSSHLNRVAKPDGWLILSGFIAEKVPSFVTPALEMIMGDWRCWVCKPQAAGSQAEVTMPVELQPFASEWW